MANFNMNSSYHSFKHRQQGSALVTVLGGVVVTVSVLFLLVKLAGSGYTATVADTTDHATATRILPSGQLKMGDGVEPGQRTGKQVFDKICIQCHAADSSVAHAPKLTNNSEWSARIAKGFDTLVKNAINGFTDKGNMPARGGSTELTDDEVARAVAYMVNQSGGGAPDESTIGSKSGSTASSASAPAGEESAPASSAVSESQAQALFEKTCFACHGANSAVPHAPKITRHEDWSERIKQGKETLFKHAIEGYTNPKTGGVMPARGGSNFSDDEIKAIVTYMVNQSGGKI